MKDLLIKSSLAMAIAAVAAPVTSSAAEMDAPGVTVSGRYRAKIVCKDAADTDCGLKNASSRFRIAASQDLGNGLSAIGKYEFQVEIDEGRLRGGLKSVVNVVDADGNLIGAAGVQDNKARVTYVGLKGGFGEITVGSRWTPLYNTISSPVDPNNMVGGTSNAGIGFITDFRQSDGLHYKKGFGEMANLHVMLQLDDGDEGNDFVDEIQAGLAMKLGSVNLGLAHKTVTDGDDTTGVNVGGNFGSVNVGVSYFMGENGDALAGLVGFGLGAGNLNLTFGMDMPDGDDAAEPTSIAVEYAQKLSANVRWFAGYETEDMDDGGDNVNHYGVGLRFDF